MFVVNHPPKYIRPNKSRYQKELSKRKGKSFRKAIVTAWEDFCTTSSFVGFRYIYYKNRTILDILFWVLLMVVLMYGSIAFVSDFLDRYHSLSTTAVITSQHYPVSSSIFPAITACLSDRVSKSRVDRFINEYINTNEDLKKSVNLTDFVKIFDLKSDADSATLSNAEIIFSTYNLTMRDMLYMTTEDCDEIFITCRWEGQIIPCTKIFKRTMAVGGFCCSFNFPISAELMRKRKWLRTNTFGINGGLTFIFKIMPNEDYFSKVVYGDTLRLLIHQPSSIPIFDENDILISRAMETSIEIQNVVNTADSKVRSLPIGDRDCVFSAERTLTTFSRYSNSNCLIQCRIHRVIHNCGCVSYYLPSNESNVCAPEQFHCSYTSRNVGSKHGNKNVYNLIGDCDCPDDCAVVKQYRKIHSWEFRRTNYSVDDIYDNVTEDNGIVHIFFSKSTTMRINRKLSFDEIELASSIGGIVALFLGCSFVSAIEIIYFLTIRMLKFYYSAK